MNDGESQDADAVFDQAILSLGVEVKGSYYKREDINLCACVCDGEAIDTMCRPDWTIPN